MRFFYTIAACIAVASTLSSPAWGRAINRKEMAVDRSQLAAVVSETDFCFFLPPVKGKGTVSDNEDKAVAYCTRPMHNARGARIFPEGFIKSAHFVQNRKDNWVQVTGRFDRKKYALDKDDGGGQYDIKAPVGALCADHHYFVNFVEPSSNVFGIRCCVRREDCPVNHSTYGSTSVLKGDYS